MFKMRKFGEVALNSKTALNLHKEISTDPKRGGAGGADENYRVLSLEKYSKFQLISCFAKKSTRIDGSNKHGHLLLRMLQLVRTGEKETSKISRQRNTSQSFLTWIFFFLKSP
jgi:hypothetical protein